MGRAGQYYPIAFALLDTSVVVQRRAVVASGLSGLYS